MTYNQECADWVYDTIAKMDDGEAQLFATMVTHDVWHRDMEANERTLRGFRTRYDAMVTEEVAKACLEHLLAGDDPEEAVAVAAAVAIAKADSDHWKYQERTQGGRFGRMTRGEYRAQKKRAKWEAKADYRQRASDLRAERVGLRNEKWNASNYAGDAHNVRNTVAAGSRFQEEWNKQGRSDSSSAPTYRRIEAGGKLVQELGVAASSPSTATAGMAARYAGQFGPEAEKIIGPSMRRAAYRYRGTERTPDSGLIDLIKDKRGKWFKAPDPPPGNPGKKMQRVLTPEEKTYAAHEAAVEYLLLGPKVPKGKNRESRVPNSNLSALHAASGRITPSEGIIINSEGHVAHQAVGFGEDHYLPFNMKNLDALEGGTYVRTRESGGPTTEDIYTGLMTGARSMTVVSNSGIFTVNFDDTLRGGRRYGDKARQMVDRYGKTLDAVKSKEVANPARQLKPDDRVRIRQQALLELSQDDSLKYFSDEAKEAYVQDKLEAARKSPMLSDEKLQELRERAKKGTSDKREAETHFQALVDEESTNTLARNYQLDGEGYSVAMDALKEQFPYFIADVAYKTKQTARGNERSDLSLVFNESKDRGYVKPRYVRPEGARSGYFDTTITGEGKRSADRDHYQNWSHNPQRAGNSKNETSGAAETGQPSAAAVGSVKGTKEKIAQAREENEFNERMKGDTRRDADWWVRYNRANDEEISDNQYPTLYAYQRAEDKDAFLSDPQQAAVLRKETERLRETMGPDLVKDRINPPTNVMQAMKSEAKPWDEKVVQSVMPPERPAKLTTGQRDEFVSTPGVRQFFNLDNFPDDATLFKESQRLRRERETMRIANPQRAKQFDETLLNIERARAVRQEAASRARPVEVDDSAFSSGSLREIPTVTASEVKSETKSSGRDHIRLAQNLAKGGGANQPHFQAIREAAEDGDLEDYDYEILVKRALAKTDLSEQDRRNLWNQLRRS